MEEIKTVVESDGISLTPERIFSEVMEAYHDIPFENSRFRTEKFVVNDSVTPRRAYRNIGLRMVNRIRALKDAKYNYAKKELEYKRKLRRIERLKKDQPTDWDIDVSLIELEIDHDMSDRDYSLKLVNDAVKELEYLYGLFKNLPKFTREEFERAETKYFTTKLSNRMLGLRGAAESAVNMLLGDPYDALYVERPIGINSARSILEDLAANRRRYMLESSKDHPDDGNPYAV